MKKVEINVKGSIGQNIVADSVEIHQTYPLSSDKADFIPSQDDQLKKLIAEHKRRLQKLKEQQAKQGISTEPSIITEIEDIEASLEKLYTELESVKSNEDLGN